MKTDIKPNEKTLKQRTADELQSLCEKHGTLDPETAVKWASSHPDSALYARLEWDDSTAAHTYRLIQMRNIITEVEVIYPDGKKHQVYVSPIEMRGKGGYVPLVEVMSDEERKRNFLAQALADYQRLGERYAELQELAGIRRAVSRLAAAKVVRKKKAAA